MVRGLCVIWPAGFAFGGRGKPWNSGIVAGLQRRPPVQSFPEILPVILDGLTGAQFLILQVDLLLTTQGLVHGNGGARASDSFQQNEMD